MDTITSQFGLNQLTNGPTHPVADFSYCINFNIYIMGKFSHEIQSALLIAYKLPSFKI